MEAFKLVTFEEGGKMRAGVLRGETVWALEDLQASFAKRKRSLRVTPKGVPLTVLSLLDGLDEKVERIGELLDLARGGDLGRPLSSVRLRAPILYPSKVLCAGANYVEHAREMGSQSPERPVDKPYFFSKTPTNTVIGPGEPIRYPKNVGKIDWEVELALVIGRRAKGVPKEEAFRVIAGYTIVNDISCREWNPRGKDSQFRHDWFAGKCLDTFLPMGPGVVPKAFVRDPGTLWLRLLVNGVVKQDSNTKHLIFNIPEMIEYVTAVATLEPGDVIATGTPSGVGMGRGEFLKPGDLVRAEGEGLGVLENPVMG